MARKKNKALSVVLVLFFFFSMAMGGATLGKKLNEKNNVPPYTDELPPEEEPNTPQPEEPGTPGEVVATKIKHDLDDTYIFNR